MNLAAAWKCHERLLLRLFLLRFAAGLRAAACSSKENILQHGNVPLGVLKRFLNDSKRKS
jgi:hypothetical protein